MSHIEQTVEVAVPVRTAYNQWTQFEEFPRFMDGVDQVEQLNDTTLRWTADVGGRTRTWEAKITEQQPDMVVAWKSIGGAPNDGIVTFQPVDQEHTRIRLALDVDPQGPIETAGDALGFVKRRVEGDLKRFKEFVEHRGTESGGWRGTVEAGASSGSEHAGSGRARSSDGSPADEAATPSRGYGGSMGGPETSDVGTERFGGSMGDTAGSIDMPGSVPPEPGDRAGLEGERS